MNLKSALPVIQVWLKKNWVDLALVLFSIFCLARFVRLSSLTGTPAGHIAKIEEGFAIRRTPTFLKGSSVSKGSKLFNYDFIWVPEGSFAVLKFRSGQKIRLLEKSLLVLKLPFNFTREKVIPSRLVYGRYLDIENNQLKKSEDFWAQMMNSYQRSVIDDEADLEKMNSDIPVLDRDRKIPATPENGAIIYRDGLEKKAFNFIIPRKTSGTALVREVGTDWAEMAELRDTNTFKLVLTNGKKYQWQVTNDNGQTFLGPIQFELRSMRPDSLKEVQALPPEQQKKIQFEIK